MTYISKYLEEVVTIAESISLEQIQKLADIIAEIRKNKGRLFFLGVGGSAANCSHAVNDFRKLVGVESYAITDNVSELTARINDEGWDTCFEKWLKGSVLSDNDAIFVLSVGGGSTTTSSNIAYAIDLAKRRHAKILSIVSRDGGWSKIHSDVCVLIPVVSEERITPHAEEWQGVVWHLVANMLKENVDANKNLR